MPSDRLNATTQAVLHVLAGTPLTQAAHDADVKPTDLAAAVDLYQQAGRQALEQQEESRAWWQLSLEFADWSAAEATMAHHLLPTLRQAEDLGSVTSWWFIRKHPCWRLRLQTTPDSAARDSVTSPLNELVSTGLLHHWRTGIYEPETAAFGGPPAMSLAHDLFHTDSRAILTQASQDTSALGRRETSILLCTTLLRAAGLEWYEQGDVWHRVIEDEQRRLPHDVQPEQLSPLAEHIRQLLLADTAPDGPLLNGTGPLAPIADAANAFRHTGTALGTAAHHGTLGRGLRRVLSLHVIFHWNRLGLPLRTQSILATAARTAILG